MLHKTKKEGVQYVLIHILLEDRNATVISVFTYIDKLEDLLKELDDNSYNAKIYLDGGRMKITMDHYQTSWSIVEAGKNIHI